MTLTGCEFHFFATFTELATEVGVAFHADNIRCAWLQVSTKYFKVILSIFCTWFDKFRYLLWKEQELPIKRWFSNSLQLTSILTLIKWPNLSQRNSVLYSFIWHFAYLFSVSFFMVSQISFHGYINKRFHICIPRDFKISIGFFHGSDCWGFRLYCRRRDKKSEGKVSSPPSRHGIHSLPFHSVNLLLNLTLKSLDSRLLFPFQTVAVWVSPKTMNPPSREQQHRPSSHWMKGPVRSLWNTRWHHLLNSQFYMVILTESIRWLRSDHVG